MLKIISLATLVALSAIGLAQDSTKANVTKVTGTVLDRSGRAIAGASVDLNEKNQANILAKTTTDDNGEFAAPVTRAGIYVLRVSHDGFSDAVLDPLRFDLRESKHLSVTLERTSDRDVTSSAAEAMQFEDKPNFTVAGVTDWTAVGGHGADTNLRTSETLAKETVALEAKSNSGTAISANDSEAKLRIALRKSPHDFETNRRLGKVYLSQRRFAEAVSPLETASRIDPGNYSNALDLAQAYKGGGNVARARAQAEKLIHRQDKAELRRFLGDLDEENNDPLGAVREYEKAVQLDPSEENYFRWGTELLLHRAVGPALEVFKKGVKSHGDSERILAGLGAALYASGAYDQAAVKLCAASDMDPAEDGPYVFLGQMEIGAPTPLPCVVEKLERFVHLHPENAAANFYYAMAIWKRQKDFKGAAALQPVETFLDRAVSINPKFAEAYLQLGILQFSQGDIQKAIAAYKSSIAADPQIGEAHYRLAVAYQRTGNEDAAQKEFKLHDDAEKTQSEAVEKQRREIRQFFFVMKDQAAPAVPAK